MGVRPTGASAAGFGLNWEFTKKDRLIAQQVMDFLCDKRVLTIGWARPEREAQSCLASAAACRTQLTEYLDQIVKPGSDLRPWLRAIRTAFTDFIEAGNYEAGGILPTGKTFLPLASLAPEYSSQQEWGEGSGDDGQGPVGLLPHARRHLVRLWPIDARHDSPSYGRLGTWCVED